MKSKFKNHLLQQKVKYACSFYEYQDNEGPEAGVKRKEFYIIVGHTFHSGK